MPLAYIFERFPAPTQTFCVREVAELAARGLAVPLFSLRQDPDAAQVPLPDGLAAQLTSLPGEAELRAFYAAEKQANRLPQPAVLTIRHWGGKPDKERVYEAIWLGQKLTASGISHVHCHFAGLAARTCWWLRQLYGIRYSFTAHANDVFCQDEIESPVTLAHLVQAAEIIVTVSEFTAQWLRDRFPAATKRIRVVYNGLDMQPIAEQTAQVPKANPPLIASVGRLIEKKGFDDLITACGLLRDQGVAFQCEIIGGGPDAAALHGQIAALQLGDHVRLLGSQGQPQVRSLLGRASVFALPCVTEKSGGMDNLPTVLMEAMAARLPCVSTVLAGVPEMVEHRVTGLLGPERQPQVFAELLAEILANAPQAKAESMGEAGWQRAQRYFAKEQTIPKLLQAFSAANADGRGSIFLKLKHFFQSKPPKAACLPVENGQVKWIGISELPSGKAL